MWVVVDCEWEIVSFVIQRHDQLPIPNFKLAVSVSYLAISLSGILRDNSDGYCKSYFVCTKFPYACPPPPPPDHWHAWNFRTAADRSGFSFYFRTKAATYEIYKNKNGWCSASGVPGLPDPPGKQAGHKMAETLFCGDELGQAANAVRSLSHMSRDGFYGIDQSFPALKTSPQINSINLALLSSSLSCFILIKAGPPLDLSFWSFLTFLHHGIDEVERHLLSKFHKKIRRKSWSNVPPKLLAYIRFLYKVVHKIGRLRKFNRAREIEFNFFAA